jgi:hypothetical protein
MTSEPPQRRTLRIPRMAAVTIVVLLLVELTALPAPARVMLGAHVQTPRRMDATAAVKRFERKIGRRLPALRLFYEWDSEFPNPHANWARRTHHRLFISVKAKTDRHSGYIDWRKIAEAEHGSRLYRRIVGWAEGVKRFGARLLFSFHPEPESWSSDPHGGPADFQAAWRRVWQVFRARRVRNATWVWTMTDWAFHADDQRAARNWWPGARYVDAIGADVYNWWKCRHGGDGWTQLERDIEALRRFGRRYPGKDIYVPEFGSVEDRSRPGRKARWLRNVRKLLKRPRYRQFKGLFYFHRKSTDDGICDWRVDTSTSSLNAFRDLVRDRFYRIRTG